MLKQQRGSKFPSEKYSSTMNYCMCASKSLQNTDQDPRKSIRLVSSDLILLEEHF